MKKFWLLALILVLAPAFIQAQETIVDATFWVRGNCGSCEKRIEKTLKKVDGVTEAEWDQESGNVTVKFDPEKTNQEALELAVAKAGHATKNHEADEENHADLPKCCREGFQKHTD